MAGFISKGEVAVSVIIVNFRTLAFTVEAIDSAIAEPEAREIIVVDNHSADGSAETLATMYAGNDRVQIIPQPKNGGFGAGNNVGSRSASEKYLFLLNSDATLTPGCLSALLKHRAQTGIVGISAPVVRVTGTGEVQQDAVGIFPFAARIVTRRTRRTIPPERAEWVSGCAMLIDLEIFNRIGGFDEEIFMYLEDVLLCWEVTNLGGQITYCPDATVAHRGGKSEVPSLSKKAQYFRSQDLLLTKFGEPLILRLAVQAIRRVTRLVKL